MSLLHSNPEYAHSLGIIDLERVEMEKMNATIARKERWAAMAKKVIERYHQELIVRKFTEKGYGNVIPEIVFWNLRDSELL